MQDRQSGAQANTWGRETARRIAEKLGATGMRRASNECVLNGQRAVIKCAGPKTRSVGVTYKMIERIDVVVAAFAGEHATFQLFVLSPEEFKKAMRETRSRGASAGKVGLVERRVFEQLGKDIGRVQVDRRPNSR